MRVLVLGWEYPPYVTGGLGTYCYELIKRLKNKGIDVLYVMPKREKPVQSDTAKIIEVGPDFRAGGSYSTYKDAKVFKGDIETYNGLVVDRCKGESFDVIHAQDWMVFPAAVELKKLTGKPLICHVHSIEYLRTPHDPWFYVVDKEKWGYTHSDLIIANSHYMKRNVVEKLGIDPAKIAVIYNGVDAGLYEGEYEAPQGLDNTKVVLYLGRLFVQKGPDYFISAAKKVLDKYKNVKFMVVGTGDMMKQLVNMTVHMGISDKVMFLGFVPEHEKPKYYGISDVYVLPSIAEPFGITVLEAAAAGVPTIVSKQSGVSEVLKNSFKVDFWDVDEMANMMIGLLNHPPMARVMAQNGRHEIRRLSWEEIADQTIAAYSSVGHW